MLLALLLNAWLFRQLGTHGFGLIAFGTGVAAFTFLANAGLPGSLNRTIALGASPERAGKLFDTALFVTVVLGGLLAFAVALSAGWLGRTVFSALGTQFEVAGVLRLSVLLLLCESLDALSVAAMRGAGRERAIAMSELAFRLLHTLAVGGAAVFSQDAGTLIGVVLLAASIRVCMRLGLARRLLGVTGCRPRIGMEALSALFEFGRWQWLKQSGSVLYGAADRLLFGGLFGSTQLAHYTLCVQLAQVVLIVPAALLQPSMGPIARAMESGNALPQLGRQLRMIQLGVLGIALLVLAGSPWVLEWMIGKGEPAVDSWMMVLAVLASTLIALQVAPNFILLGAGKNRCVGLLGFFGSLATLLLCWLVHPFGPTAFMAARCLQGCIALGNYPMLRLTLLKLMNTSGAAPDRSV